MSSDARTQATPRALAVAGAPVDALLARTDELARRWAIGLILSLPLERIGELPLETFASEAPSLCAQVVRALASDEELERIAQRTEPHAASSPARRLAEMTGARDGTAAVEAVETLRGVLWQGLLDELRWNSFDESVPTRMVADLADRLAYVCSTALVSSLTDAPGVPASARAVRAGVHAARAGAQVARAGTPAASAGSDTARTAMPRVPDQIAAAPIAPAATPQPATTGRGRRAALGNGVVIVDEALPPARRSQWPGRAAPAPGTPIAPGVRPPDSGTRGRPLPWDTPLERAPDGRDERA